MLARALRQLGDEVTITPVHSAAPLAIFLKIKPLTLVASLLLAVTVGVLSTIIPSYRASHMNIVEGLRHIG